jgi:fumarate reductase (CoM/CoB) subunit A
MNAVEIDKVITDVAVVGAGGAGMRAAIAAAEAGARVIVLTKGQAARSGATPMACPSYQAAFAMEDDRDSPEVAFEDTRSEGRYLGDENLIWVLTHEATDRAMDLLRYGVKFRKKDDGKFLQVVHPGHSYERNLVILGGGYALAAALRRQALKMESITLMEDVVATRLFCSKGSIAGMIGLDMRSGRPILIRASAVIIATGGYAELWRWTDTEPGLTGEGVLLAYQVGADLVDLEMMLFYPTGLCYPPEVEGTLVQYEGLLTDKYCAGAMVNGKGETFLPTTGGLPVRDVMMRLMFQEIENNRAGPHGGLFIDLTRSPRSGVEIREILSRLDSLPYDQLRSIGLNVLTEAIEVMPVTHYTLGGIRVDEWGQTSVAGLFAAGEVSGNVHGANRTSGNALAETQVFGARAGARAAAYAMQTGACSPNNSEVGPELTRIAGFMEGKPHALRPIDLKRKVKATMHNRVRHRRNAEGLRAAIEELQQMQKEDIPRLQASEASRIYNYELEEALEVSSMVTMAEMVAASALAREETRGHHWRTDFATTNVDWEKHTIVRLKDSGEYEVADAPVVRLRPREGGSQKNDGIVPVSSVPERQ